MSEHETPDFVTDIGADGSITVPASYLRSLGFHPGARASVRVTELVLSDELRQRGITEPVVDHIGATQLEPRENVLSFLASEGSVPAGFAARMKDVLRSGS